MLDSRSPSSGRPAADALSRRDLLTLAGAGAAGLALAPLLGYGRLLAGEPAVAAVPATADGLGKVLVEEPFGRLIELAEGLWAVESTPLGRDYTTLCNGGLVAGSERVLVVEGFGKPEGARWITARARELTGRAPTDVVISHYHGDHVNGLGGFRGEKGEHPKIWITARTRDLVLATDAKEEEKDAARAELIAAATLLGPDAPTPIELGGRRVLVHPRSGHTASDVTIEVEEPSIVYFGDLLWNAMFPNYVDAVPSELSKSVRATIRERPTIYVPGHGPLADAAAVGRYLAVIDHVEEVARQSFEAGVGAAEAAKTFTLPAAAGEWFRFNESYYERALAAWHRELGG